MHIISETLLLLLYRAVKTHGGWGINNRLIRGLMKDNLLYCSSGFGWCLYRLTNTNLVYLLAIFTAFAVGIILTTMFFPVS
jgi:hypothetical protein